MDQSSIIVPRHVQARREEAAAAKQVMEEQGAKRAAEREAAKIGGAAPQGAKLAQEPASVTQSAEEAGLNVRTVRSQPADAPAKP